MARCKLTSMNLRNIRKTREYQCLIIDLVNTGVMTKSAAEALLGYTIPAGLLTLGSGTVGGDADDDDNESGSGSGSGSGSEGGSGSGSGSEGGSDSTETTTIKINLGTLYNDSGIWNMSQVYEPEADNPLEIEVEVPTDVLTRLNTAVSAHHEGGGNTDVSEADWSAFSTALNTAVQAAIESNPGIKTGLGFSSDASLTVMPSRSGFSDIVLFDKNSAAALDVELNNTENTARAYAGYGDVELSDYTNFLNADAVYVVNVDTVEE